jgi:uncharacterized membrane protein (DUF4010 family)
MFVSDSPNAIWSLLVAALLGFLIGLERERKREMTGSIFAGIRTFPLIALFGAILSRVAVVTTYWVIVAGILAISSLLLLAYWRTSAGPKVGGTTEVAAFVAFGLGVLAGLDAYVTALAGAVITTGILSLRQELRHLVGGLSQADLYAVVQFAVVSLVVLPLVPDQDFGPWGVWNPIAIWRLVVLISGVSFIGYILSKWVSTERSLELSGFLGGLASSTAVTLSFGEQSKRNPLLSTILASGILIATAVSMFRLMIFIGVAQGELLVTVLPVLLSYGLVAVVGGWLTIIQSHKQKSEAVKLSNPFELRTAITFALLFAVVLLVTRAAQELFGNQGIYVASILAGLAQLDAIALTLARQVGQGLEPVVASRGLALALLGNSLFKSGLVISLAAPQLSRRIILILMIAALCAVVVAWVVPADIVVNLLEYF